MSARIGVIDYGAGNIGSILNMVSHVGGTPFVVSDRAGLDQADRLILPGVGHFDHGIRMLRNKGLYDPLSSHDGRGQPLLGICLGMQLLLSSSEEGEEVGLGLVPGECRRFRPADPRLKVPHMGWNVVRPTGESTALAAEVEDSRYYFVHSFYAAPESAEHVAGTTHYDVDFCSVVDTGTGVLGYQFHPEKSHRFGMALLRAFAVPPC